MITTTTTTTTWWFFTPHTLWSPIGFTFHDGRCLKTNTAESSYDDVQRQSDRFLSRFISTRTCSTFYNCTSTAPLCHMVSRRMNLNGISYMIANRCDDDAIYLFGSTHTLFGSTHIMVGATLFYPTTIYDSHYLIVVRHNLGKID